MRPSPPRGSLVVEVWRPINQQELALVRSVLDAASIPYFVENGQPAEPRGQRDGVARVMVRAEDAADATSLLEGDFLSPV